MCQVDSLLLQKTLWNPDSSNSSLLIHNIIDSEGLLGTETFIDASTRYMFSLRCW